AMAMAVGRLKTTPSKLIIDGTALIPLPVLSKFWRRHHEDTPLPREEAVIKADLSVPAVSAASILAKTYRDNLMQTLDVRWPLYGFAKHVGYGSAHHRAMLKKYGPCPLHRLSFRGVRQEEQVQRQGSLLG
ncbi:MAG: ribonuclease HII, partial [Desulfovibrio sp.]|nr:ribonuclease HII [Desulfovibrio sp.]